jgi:dihydropteroate synthase
MTGHNPTLKFFHSAQEACAEMERMGVHQRGIELMCKKATFRVVKLEGVGSAAAHILKQEMLAADGEAATNRGTIDGSAVHTDVLLMGTEKVFNRLLEKLQGQPYGLPSIAEEVRSALDNSIAESFRLSTARRELTIGAGILVMGVLNVTPDSFYPASRSPELHEAVDKALKMIEEGADIIDAGGESTRPGAAPIDEKEERRRVMPVIELLAAKVNIPISVDTRKASVARAAVDAGAEMINDVSGLRFDPDMARVVAESGSALILNHSRGTPEDMQKLADYGSLVSEVVAELRVMMERAMDSGVHRDSVIIDPGLGFAKTPGHNFQILKHLREFRALGRPLMVGPSRKSFLSRGGELSPEDRLEASLAASVVAAVNGAHIIRTHDVAAVKKALWVVDRME